MASLLQLHDESMLSPWALMAFTQLAEPSRQQAGDRARLCERGIRFSPTRWLATSCAMQLALAGTEGEARRLIGDVLRAYPKERAATYDQLRAGVARFPELEALRAFASEGSNAPRQPG